MATCMVCGGSRVIKTAEGIKCRDSACSGSKALQPVALSCEICDEPMTYQGLNSWGEPNYRCPQCGTLAKL